MKRTVLLPLVLALVGLPLAAADRREEVAAPTPAHVVVDPLDFRKPIPDPDQGLTDKYDGKLVRFTGVVRRVGLGKGARKHTFVLQHDIVSTQSLKGKRVPVLVDSVVVTVTFQGDDAPLRAKLLQASKARQPGPTVTVQGKASLVGDSLNITDAVLIGKGPFDVK